MDIKHNTEVDSIGNMGNIIVPDLNHSDAMFDVMVS